MNEKQFVEEQPSTTLTEMILTLVCALSPIIGLLLIGWLVCGCSSPDCGSKTIVGNHYALPKLSNDTSNTDIEVYESTEGAVVYTRKDSKVEIEYKNVYTNHILGVWNKVGSMILKVVIEPLDCSGTAAGEMQEENDEDEKR